MRTRLVRGARPAAEDRGGCGSRGRVKAVLVKRVLVKRVRARAAARLYVRKSR